MYGQDFYSGHAAVTHHVFGKGHAYYIGARLDDAGNAAVLRAALADAKVHLRDLPQGVEYYCREARTRATISTSTPPRAQLRCRWNPVQTC